ncbi:MAG: 1-(5-phosphoribosyl)-5-[(5-phosphoribosylamino)methylideneamino]imidazole-4-carboxamide isomerase [Elusimicrobia bacterium RIFCSPLOWO2_01_FULL_59_12]|nr:MAG: 1-(5-phosphoribosyl)-5-[(5-phosphoribosylamino)methylideneamino]imidazole-4-carboxamide isomerase [Elusimicrobia bacterium RIFCSPLOWO2_01_FULL_59_12]
MLILPAIDIRHGNCVRLYQGRPEEETLYSDDPVQVAREWKAKGATMLHVVDLDGAFEGKPVNLLLVAQMCEDVKIPIELGGGFRDLPAIQQAFDAGAARVILGTAAIKNPGLVKAAVEEYGGDIAVSIDVTGTFATSAGWKEVSTISAGELAAKMRELGVEELLFTNTQRDGTLQGPDLNAIKNFLTAAEVPVIVSGGITTLDDIYNLKQLEPLGLKGAVIGKALYDRKIQLEDALRIA